MKKALETTLTQKGQVTVPLEIRVKLGLKARDKVAFEIDGDEVRLKPIRKNDLRRGYGAVRAIAIPEEFDSVREFVERQIARDTVSRDS